jgi:hypothetical protein
LRRLEGTQRVDVVRNISITGRAMMGVTPVENACVASKQRAFLIAIITIVPLFLDACGVAAPPYPSFKPNAYRIEGNGTPAAAGAPARTVVYRDGSNFRIDTMLPRYGRATVVFDAATGGAYILNPTPQQAAHRSDGPSDPTASANGARVALRISDGDAPQPLESQWASFSASSAHSAGVCTVAGQSGHEWTHAAARDIERSACIAPDGIVLRLRENHRTLFETTSLQRGRHNPALFGVPRGYQLINPDAVTVNADDRAG